MKPVVVIPVHQPCPSAEEQISLERCGEILGGHEIKIIHPTNIESNQWSSLIPSCSTQGVPPEWMKSIRAYNKMMINPDFFQLFDAYTHLLVHEPDALVVSDRLLEWCQSGFDYIGAPWFEGYSKNPPPGAPLVAVGNSGFSLLNLQSARAVLESRYRWYPYHTALKDVFRHVLRRPGTAETAPLKAIFGNAGELRGAHITSYFQCDVFWSTFAPKARPEFSIPGPEKAVFFAWETSPSICYKLCGETLPFGIHAWAKYDRDFIEKAVLGKT